MIGITTILRLRSHQGYRMLRSVGWPLLILGVPMIAVLSLGVVERSTDGYSMSLLFGLGVVSLHNYRKDHNHLRLLGYQPRLVCMIEYLIIAVFLGMMTWLLVGNYSNLLLMALTSLIVAHLPNVSWAGIKKRLFFPVSWIPLRDFEYRSGMRISGWLVVVLISFGALVAYSSPIVPIVSVIMISITATSWHMAFEPIAMIDLQQRATQFLLSKIIKSLKYLLLFFLPIGVAYLIHYSELWYLFVVVVLFGILINSFAIFYKYTGYHPSRESAHGEMAVGLFSMCSLVPFFAPVCLFYLVVYFRKALSNLNPILC